MMSRIFPLLCILTLALGSTTVQKESESSGKKKFDDTIVRSDVIHVNKIITTIKNNWHLQETAEGLVELCDMIQLKYPAEESNEVFKAGKVPSPLNESLKSLYLYGTYFVCPTHSESPVTPNKLKYNGKIFDGKHTTWLSHGDSDEPCDIVYGVPLAYIFSNSHIDRPEYPEVNPSIVIEFPNAVMDEMRSLGSIPGLGKAWDDIYIGVGGLMPDVYQYQFIAFPVTKKACPDIDHPALETMEQPELPSSIEVTAQNLRG